ncbi:hypothetical protein CK203_022398 [Vitis vinifera]|uniref:Uncharacterized protein n=1 Tax=Vitis vinifera TaxID=29760 RepID=A0A438I9I3_VITVI|nr:hypothetical protein CK203_022398 [Vitis vinifera]
MHLLQPSLTGVATLVAMCHSETGCGGSKVVVLRTTREDTWRNVLEGGAYLMKLLFGMIWRHRDEGSWTGRASDDHSFPPISKWGGSAPVCVSGVLETPYMG